MEILIFLLMIGSIALIIYAVSGKKKIPDARLNLYKDRPALERKIRMGSFLSAIFPFAQKVLEKLKLDTKLKTRMDAAHSSLTPVEFFNLKLLLMVILAVVTVVAVGKSDPIVIIVALAFGYILPDIWLNRKIAKRKYAIARLLPEVVDLLGLCVEAGLDFTTAVKWVIEKVKNNPLLEEFSFVLKEIQWGKPRVQALRDMSKRLNIPEVSSFVQTLVQAERMGAPVAEAFTILSEDTRLQRFHRGERIAMQAPLKILIPLIFCILPVIGIVIGGPIFLQFMQGGLLKGF